MSHFKCRVDGLTTLATENTFRTLLGLRFTNTAGHRGALRKLIVGGANVTPQDIQVSLRLRRTGNSAAGTCTAINVNTIGKADPNSIASVMNAIGANYTVEPTTFETGTLGIGSLNTRGTLVMEWGFDEAPKWGPNQTLCLEAAPGSGAAASLEVSAEWEEY